jgi:hypothetical protein
VHNDLGDQLCDVAILQAHRVAPGRTRKAGAVSRQFRIVGNLNGDLHTRSRIFAAGDGSMDRPSIAQFAVIQAMAPARAVEPIPIDPSSVADVSREPIMKRQ